MNRSSNVRRRAQQRRRSGTQKQADENIAVFRLAVCGIIFVLFIAVKLLFPETASRIAQSAGQLLGRNADFKEAFAAMGRAVSGEEPVTDSLQDAYTAVFNPSVPNSEDEEALEPPQEDTQDAPDVQNTAPDQPDTPEDSPAPSDPPEDTPAAAPETPAETPEPDDTAVSDALSYVYTMPALPDNASLEQRNLGFSHSTPVFGVLSSSFGWREHPVEGGSKFHYGVDLAADEGTDICAFADGTVYASGESSSLGNYIMLQHEGGYITLYAHCSKVTASGGSVAMGDKIAEVGSTGLATGPHLHFELHDGSLYLNPIFYVDVG